jgi:hypothetical protein
MPHEKGLSAPGGTFLTAAACLATEPKNVILGPSSS